MMTRQTEPPSRVHRSLQLDVNLSPNQSRFVTNNQAKGSEARNMSDDWKSVHYVDQHGNYTADIPVLITIGR